MSGAAATAIGAGSKALLQVVAIMGLARLLTPEDFGVVGMVFPIIAFAAIFQEAGLTLAVIQRERITDREVSTIFWLNAGLGLLLCLLLIVMAPWIAHFYREPRVASLTAASGALVLLGALSAQHLALLIRDMQFVRLAAIDVLSLLVGTVLAVIVALLYRTYWAIFLLSLGTAAANCVLAWGLSGWRPGRRAPLREVGDLIRFGGHFTLENIATYFGRNLDKVLIGRFFGSAALGYYERAYKIVLLPILFVHNPLLRLALPMLSQLKQDPERYRRICTQAFQLALLLTVPGIVVLIVAAPQMVALIMGQRWVEGAAIFAWLGVACLGQLATGPLTIIFVSQDRAREAMMASVVTSIYSSVAFVIGLRWGAVGVAAAYAVSEIVRTPVMLWYATRKGPVSFADMGCLLLPFLAAIPICALVVFGLAHAMDEVFHPLVFAAAAVAASYAATLPCLLMNRVGRAFLAEMTTIGRSFFRKAVFSA